jgi:2-polyprenyl-3-methyl-5-hydroxy-6-metoxy-1,4-benzoquinol methylase
VVEEFSKAFWEERYRGDTAGHPGHTAGHNRQPSPHLVAETCDLTPGTALDAGCGAGANAIWLASQGWRVTAVDIASNALRRAREQAEVVGVATRVDWVEADLTSWTPATEQFDLVCAHYVHPAGSHEALLRRLAASVAPGGTLLIVDHQSADQHFDPDQHLDPGQHLDPEQWDIAVAEVRTRSAAGHDGHEVVLRDAVFRACKRPSPSLTAAPRPVYPG